MPKTESNPAAAGSMPRPSTLSLVEILFSAVTGTAAEIFLKLGASETASHFARLPWLGISGLASRWVWLAIAFTIVSFVAWLRALRIVPLGLAFALSSVIHVFVPFSCWVFLGEAISPRRWVGIVLVVAGLAIVARPFARLEGKLDEAL